MRCRCRVGTETLYTTKRLDDAGASLTPSVRRLLAGHSARIILGREKLEGIKPEERDPVDAAEDREEKGSC